MVATITDALDGVLGEDVRDQIAVRLVGVPAGRSGVAGRLA
ncbi:hypothetical protein [Spongiactinospora sp. 9N601]